MAYKVIFTKTALDSLKKIDRTIINRIIDKIDWLSLNLDLIKPIKLKGNLSSLYKLRVGNYRVIYEIDLDKLEITIHFVGHRRDIYKI